MGNNISNFLIKNAMQNLKGKFSDLDEKDLRKKIENLIKIISTNISDLEYDERNQPFKILGIPITVSLLKSLGIGIASGFSVLLQSSFSN